jgi:hypothetical protein
LLPATFCLCDPEVKCFVFVCGLELEATSSTGEFTESGNRKSQMIERDFLPDRDCCKSFQGKWRVGQDSDPKSVLRCGLSRVPLHSVNSGSLKLLKVGLER